MNGIPQKTRVPGLPDGEHQIILQSSVLTRHQHVLNRQKDGCRVR